LTTLLATANLLAPFFETWVWLIIVDDDDAIDLVGIDEHRGTMTLVIDDDD
jgi:hypothetical protein